MVGLLPFLVAICWRKITVVASDGNDVEPVEVDRLLVAVSETYDVVVTIPEKKPPMSFSNFRGSY
jgi:FtsP/CotA-like multicopper oxidase with cupredoxin domain